MYQFRDINQPALAVDGLSMGFGDVVNLDNHLSRNGKVFQTLTIDGRGLLPVEADVVSVNGRHGRFFKSAGLGTRAIKVGVRLSAPNDRAFRLLFEELNGLLTSYRRIEPKALRFSDEQNRYYKALFVSADVPDDLSNDQFVTLQFMCYDPFKYSDERSVSGGRVQYNGDRMTYPKVSLTLRQSGTEVRLLHVQKQVYVRLKGRFASGDVIEIDMGKRQITHKGRPALAMLDMVNSRFFTLDKGVNDLTCNLSASLTLRFEEVFA